MKKFFPFKVEIIFMVVVFFVFHFCLFPVSTNKSNEIKIKKLVYNSVPSSVPNYNPINTFIGTMTGYGPECVGCTGLTACAPYQDVRNGNIYFEDKEYGHIRIVAADPSISCGTIVRVSTEKLYAEPIIAIVLDRGGAIHGTKFDLLFENEAKTAPVGFQRNVKYEVLRSGWGQ